MQHERLKAQVEGELAQMDRVVRELVTLKEDVGNEIPTLRDVVAAGGFLAQFYNGIENILKRITLASGVSMPSGDRWHVRLLDLFCSPQTGAETTVPVQLDAELAADLKSYLGFRHIVRSGYGMDLEWDRLVIGIENLPAVFDRFKSVIQAYLNES